jgi:hypothetical protein
VMMTHGAILEPQASPKAVVFGVTSSALEFERECASQYREEILGGASELIVCDEAEISI